MTESIIKRKPRNPESEKPEEEEQPETTPEEEYCRMEAEGAEEEDSSDPVRTTYVQRVNLRIPEKLLNKFKKKYENASAKIRELIKQDLEGETENLPVIKSGDHEKLYSYLFAYPSMEVVGNVGCGKTFSVQALIRNYPEIIFVCFDAHNEYEDLPVIDVIKENLKRSSRIVLPNQVSAARGLLPIFVNQILSKQWSYVFIVEESMRYNHLLQTLAGECRKFAKCIFVTQKRNFCFIPAVRVVR